MSTSHMFAVSLAVSLFFSSSLALAGVGLPPSFAVIENPGTIMISPAGTGLTLQEIGSTITVMLFDINQNPVLGFPREDIWVGGDGGSLLAMCPGGSIADADTDINGESTISGSFFGGGYTGSVQVFISGVPLNQPLLPLQVVSVDLNGDRIVNIADVGLFAIEFDGAYSVLADLVPDGVNNIADVGVFAIHVGENCP